MRPARDSENLRTIIASTPGVAEQSLRATLESLASLHVVGTAAGCLSALQMARNSAADLVVIDANLPFGDVQVLLQQLEEEKPEIRSLVLVATSSQVRRALAAGADAALRRDASIRRLNAVVEGFYGGSQVEIAESGAETSLAG
jgi:DNA-binding NarL/FixJ family response regulator